jgi:hypothetical protein
MVIVIFAWRYIAVNKACPPAQVEQYSLGDTVLHNGVEYTLTDYKVLSQDEFCDEYEIDPIHVKASGQESKIIVFTMYAKNVSDHNVNVDFAGQMLLQMGDYLCSYMCYIPLYPLLNGEKPSAGVMLPGHDIELTIPYQILEMPWSTQEFAKLETERTQIVFSLYPVKKTIVLNEG